MAHMHGSFYSQALKRQAELSVLLPDYYGEPGAKKGHPIQGNFPVLYLLHGYNSDHSTWSLMTQLAFYVRNLPLAIVMPSGYNSYYANSHSGHLRYFDYLTEELPTLLHNWLSLSNAREDTFIGGLSLGGYGAMHAALAHPERYSYCFSFSGVVDVKQFYKDNKNYRSCIIHDRDLALGEWQDVEGTENDLFALIDRAVENHIDLPNLFLTCGQQDPALPYTRSMRDYLTSKNIPVRYAEYDGKHDWAFWNQVILEALSWFSLERYDIPLEERSK